MVSKYKFKITYRNEDEYEQYWDDNRYTVSIIAETLEQAKQKLDEIEKNDYRMHKNILKWEAEEITEDKDKEIERLNKRWDELEKYINEEYIYDEVGMKIFDVSTLQDKLQELKGSVSNE